MFEIIVLDDCRKFVHQPIKKFEFVRSLGNLRRLNIISFVNRLSKEKSVEHLNPSRPLPSCILQCPELSSKRTSPLKLIRLS